MEVGRKDRRVLAYHRRNELNLGATVGETITVLGRASGVWADLISGPLRETAREF